MTLGEGTEDGAQQRQGGGERCAGPALEDGGANCDHGSGSSESERSSGSSESGSSTHGSSSLSPGDSDSRGGEEEEEEEEVGGGGGQRRAR